MRFAIFGALILSMELFGVSVAGAIPASGSVIVKADYSKEFIPVMGGCGAKYKRNKQTGQCEPF
jgi:hypothetical protein